MDNSGGTLHSAATGPNRLDLPHTLTNPAGHLLLHGPTTLTTGTWTNTGGQLQITGPATLHATTLDNRGGILHTATGPLDLRVTGTITEPQTTASSPRHRRPHPHRRPPPPPTRHPGCRRPRPPPPYRPTG
nr:hypothetical protein [Xylella fastidiosa]